MLFLSHSGADSEQAKTLAALLRQANVDVWLDLEKLKPGVRWMEELETALHSADDFAVYVGESGVRDWLDREVRFALDRNAADRAFRIFPILGPGTSEDALPAFLRQHQYQRLDLSRGLPTATALERLVGAIRDEPPEPISVLPEGKSPFLGLRPFDVDDALLFYGRDREVEELLERLQRQRFLAVVGASGSGKSSLVRAGLIPALLRGRFQDGDAWAQSWRVAGLF